LTTNGDKIESRSRADRLNEEARRNIVRALFVQIFPSGRRNENDVMKFHGWLQEHRPSLLPRLKAWGDTFQHLKNDLDGLYKG